MENIGRTIVLYGIAFVLVSAALSDARPTNLSESEENGLQSLNIGKRDVVPISEVCPPWITRLSGGCRRFMRFKRLAGFCPAWMPRCPRPSRWSK